MRRKQRSEEKQQKAEQKSWAREEKRFMRAYDRAVRKHAKSLKKNPNFLNTTGLPKSVEKRMEKLLQSKASKPDEIMIKMKAINDKYLPAEHQGTLIGRVETEAKKRLADSAIKATLKNKIENTQQAPVEKNAEQLTQEIENIEMLKAKIEGLDTVIDNLAMNMAEPGNIDKLDQTMEQQDQLRAELVEAEAELQSIYVKDKTAEKSMPQGEKTVEQLEQEIEQIEDLKAQISSLASISDELAMNMAEPGNIDKLDKTMALQEQLEGKLAKAEAELNVVGAKSASKDENKAETNKETKPKEKMSKDAAKSRLQSWMTEAAKDQKAIKAKDNAQPEETYESKGKFAP